jgi:hypothetical protein
MGKYSNVVSVVPIIPSSDTASSTENINKIDAEAVDGLLGVSNSLSYKVNEIERHLHSSGRWFGSTANGAGPGLTTSLSSFEVTSNVIAETYGIVTEIFDGTEECDSSYTVLFTDPHRIFITGVTVSGIYKIRFANSQYDGTSHMYADMSAAVSAKIYTEFLLKVDSTKADAISAPVQTGRMRIGSKLWAQVMHSGSGNETVSFLIACHGYEG